MKLVENRLEYLSDFIRLNEEWIRHYFAIEAADKTLAEDPGRIIADGGYIFSLIDETTVVAVCALFKIDSHNYELARMAVSPQHQRKGYGEKLMRACLLKLRNLGARKVLLLSNTKLSAAIALYQKYGFKTVSTQQHPSYARANIVMELDLAAAE